MAKNRATPKNHPYSSFDAISVGASVHLRMTGEDESADVAYEHAELLTEPTGNVGAKSASFYIPSLGRTIPNINENHYVAWTRYE
jgi:hypothetical protein